MLWQIIALLAVLDTRVSAPFTATEIMFDFSMLLNRALVARARAHKWLFREREERHFIK